MYLVLMCLYINNKCHSLKLKIEVDWIVGPYKRASSITGMMKMIISQVVSTHPVHPELVSGAFLCLDCQTVVSGSSSNLITPRNVSVMWTRDRYSSSLTVSQRRVWQSGVRGEECQPNLYKSDLRPDHQRFKMLQSQSMVGQQPVWAGSAATKYEWL